MAATIVRNHRTTALAIAFFGLFFALAGGVEAQEVTIGREDNWSAIENVENVDFRLGRRGYLDAVLADNEYEVGPSTDLLLHFNANPPQDRAGRYIATLDGASITSDYRWLGRGSAVFHRPGDTIRLSAGEDALFAPGRLWQDFSIEFWLYPANLEEGETVLLWMGSRWQDQRPVQQELRVSVSNRTLTWSFSNFFLPHDQSELTVELSGRRSLIPRDWHHHMIRFDAGTGLLEYLVDGAPEDVTHVSASGREDGTVYFPYIGEASGTTVQLGVGFTGFLDELRMTSSADETPRLQRVSPHAGSIVSGPIDLRFDRSQVLSIDAQVDTPGESEVNLYYLVGDQRGTLSGPWTRVVPGAAIDPVASGRYLRLRADFLPGAPGDPRPSISWIRADVVEDTPPAPPSVLVADPGNGSVRLDWSEVPEPDVAGYLVYYGIASGQYFGITASQGPSPVDVGDVTSATLTGLENGRLYYFAVSAYDASRSLTRGNLSTEETARPSGRLD